MLGLEPGLSERIVGQRHALNALGRSMRLRPARLGDPARPVGSFLFVGPTGVGKTEVGKALAGALQQRGRPDPLRHERVRGVPHRPRLVGAPPGYVGYENAGELSEAVRRPYAVVLFDEVDKATSSRS